MNIEQAKAIPISVLLERMNQNPVRHTNAEAWYLSPLRKEKTASFKIHHKRNVWFDFGIGIGGDTVKLISLWLESQKRPHSVSDALHWIDSVDQNNPVVFDTFQIPDTEEDESPTLIVKSVKNLKHRALEHYLEGRGIPANLASRILKEVRVQNRETGKNMFALGLENEENGYEIRNAFFKGCVGPKHITFIRGKDPKPTAINLFEGFMDYLSMLTQQNGKPFRHDTIILNSVNCLDLAIPYIKGYGYQIAYSWFDNDEAGKRASSLLEAFCQTEEGLLHNPMNGLYRHDKDVNAYHMRLLGLKASP